jgi:uncharacterized protein
MRTYERNGVHVDQCSDCRGIFLDRGELDRLLDAEKSVQSGPRTSSHSSSDGYYGKKRKESFLSDLFG